MTHIQCPVQGGRRNCVCVLSDKLRKASKRDTPEKPGTPNASQENLLDDESIVEKKYVIINDEILAMRIKHEDLQKVGQCGSQI